MLGHECSFPNSHFLDSVVRNNKRSSGIDGKTSDCLSRNCLYYRFLSCVSARNCSLNRLNPVVIVFFADMLMVTVLLVKTTKLNY